MESPNALFGFVSGANGVECDDGERRKKATTRARRRSFGGQASRGSQSPGRQISRPRNSLRSRLEPLYMEHAVLENGPTLQSTLLEAAIRQEKGQSSLGQSRQLVYALHRSKSFAWNRVADGALTIALHLLVLETAASESGRGTALRGNSTQKHTHTKRETPASRASRCKRLINEGH